MRLSLYLNYPDDADLFMLRACHGMDFQAQVITCIRAVMHGRPYTISYNPLHAPLDGQLPKLKVDIRLAESRDGDVILYLLKIPPGNRAMMIKNMIRMCCDDFLPDILKRRDLPSCRFTFTLHKDRDLIAAYTQLGNEALAKLVKTAIRQGGRRNKDPVIVTCKKTGPCHVVFQIRIDPEKDADIMSFLSSLNPDSAGAYIKILLRRYIFVQYEEMSEKASTKKGRKKTSASAARKNRAAKSASAKPVSLPQEDLPANLTDAETPAQKQSPQKNFEKKHTPPADAQIRPQEIEGSFDEHSNSLYDSLEDMLNCGL